MMITNSPPISCHRSPTSELIKVKNESVPSAIAIEVSSLESSDENTPSRRSSSNSTTSSASFTPRRKSDSSGARGNKGGSRKSTKRRAKEPPTEDPKWLIQLRNSQRRRSRRGNDSCLQDLARLILSNSPIVIITGAGLSAASGIRPFRGSDGIWSDVIWKRSTREEFRKDPLEWYNSFWLRYFPPHTYGQYYEPNEGHEAIAQLVSMPGTNVKVITQNVDGLHSMTNLNWDYGSRLIEAHGRLGLYKCIPETDSDTDSEDDEEEDRKVKLGSWRKNRVLLSAYRQATLKYRDKMNSDEREESNFRADRSDTISNLSPLSSGLGENVKQRVPCKFEFAESIPVRELLPASVGRILAGLDPSESTFPDDLFDATGDRPCPKRTSSTEFDSASSQSSMSSFEAGKQACSKRPLKSRRGPKRRPSKFVSAEASHNSIFLKSPPLCPSCNRPCPPQALLFDEGYHSHGHYQFKRMERWIEQSTTLVFVGTSFAVSLTDCALEHAREEGKRVYNFNIPSGTLESTARLNVENVVGDVQRTLPALVKACEGELALRREGRADFLSW